MISTTVGPLNGKVGVWYRTLRPFSYPAAIVPVLVGTMLAWHQGSAEWHLFALALIGSIAIQAGTNLANEYFDYKQGLDSEASLGAAGVIVLGVIPPWQVLWGAVAAFALGSAIGFYLTAVVGWPILVIGFFSVMAGWFYTAKPLALGYRALGEPTVFLFMGVIMVMASYYLHWERFTWEAFLVSAPVGLLVTVILHTNNLRDVNEDAAKGRLTWCTAAVRTWGQEQGMAAARRIYYFLVIVSYLWVFGLVLADVVPWAALLAFASLPLAFRLARIVASGAEGKALGTVVKGTAQLHLLFGALFALGFVIEHYAR
jgi:1,4-dihydroxy-2-naphthoate octaprenyltransferase